MWLISIFLVITFVFILDYLLIDKRALELCKQFDGPFRLPLIGTVYTFFGLSTKNYYEKIKEAMDIHPKINYSWNGPSLELKVDDYKLIEAITTNQNFLAKSSQYSFMHKAVGEGLLFSTGQKWFNRRRIITPTFHFKILEQFFDVFKKQNEKLIEKIQSHSCGSSMNILPLVKSSMFASLCETAMGYEMTDDDSNYSQAIEEIELIVATRFLTPWQKSQFLFDLSHAKKKQDKYVEIARNFTTKLIEERRKILSNQKNSDLEDLDDADIGLKKKMCLLDVLLQSKIDDKPLSNEDIQEEVDTFTFAGRETMTIAICFILYTISKHPDVQEKLKQEIRDVLGDDPLTFKKLNQFKYLDIVIKETMRLYPPAPIISRRLFEEVNLGDFVAPANANYNMILYTAFRNPNVFEKPDEFIPERFLQDMPSFAFVPFSAGQKFAMTNVKTTIIAILKNFTVLATKIEPKVEINLTLKFESMVLGFKHKNL